MSGWLWCDDFFQMQLYKKKNSGEFKRWQGIPVLFHASSAANIVTQHLSSHWGLSIAPSGNSAQVSHSASVGIAKRADK